MIFCISLFLTEAGPDDFVDILEIIDGYVVSGSDLTTLPNQGQELADRVVCALRCSFCVHNMPQY